MDQTPDQTPPGHPGHASHLWIYPLALLGALALTAAGAWVARAGWGLALLTGGSVAVVVTLAAWPIAIHLSGTRAAARRQSEALLSPVLDRLEQFSVMLNTMSEQQLLSDRAKAVAYRAKDREALRTAIREEIGRGDWESATNLVNDMEISFGYKNESEQIRREINLKQTDALRKRLVEVASVIDRLASTEQWREAYAEAEKVIRQFPDAEAANSVLLDVEERRTARKRQLLEEWERVLARKDIDAGVSLLKKLDTYLTPAEAEGLQDAARGIYREKLNALRTQFTLAVQEHKWMVAVQVGESITNDFPNSGIAREVRDTMPTLRDRAGLTPVASGNGAATPS